MHRLDQSPHGSTVLCRVAQRLCRVFCVVELYRLCVLPASLLCVRFCGLSLFCVYGSVACRRRVGVSLGSSGQRELQLVSFCVFCVYLCNKLF